MRLISFYLFSSLFLVLVSACSSDPTPLSLAEKFETYTKRNKQVIFSGKVNVRTILEDADYRHIPKLNNLISKELSEFNHGIYLDSGLYFSVEGLLDAQGTPSEINVFAPIKNKDSIQDKIASLGLILEHGKNIDFAIGTSYGIGICGDEVVFHYQQEGEILPAHFDKLFKQLNQTNTTHSNLTSSPNKNAMEITTHLNHIYDLYVKAGQITLEPIKQKEVKSLLQDATLKTKINFERGGITVQTKHQFGENLRKRMFFNSTSSTPMKQLAKGKTSVGLAMNFDALKIQTLLEDFDPTFFERLSEKNGSFSLGMMALGKRPVTNLLGGRLAVVYYSESDSHSAYITLGDEGKALSGMTRSFFSSNPMYALTISNQQIIATSKNHSSSINSLMIPTFCQDFGENGIDFFMDVQIFNKHQKGLSEQYPFISVVDWMRFSMDNEGSTLRIQGRERSKGILKQVIDLYIEKIKNSI